jgi:hypothetical protein
MLADSTASSAVLATAVVLLWVIWANLLRLGSSKKRKLIYTHIAFGSGVVVEAGITPVQRFLDDLLGLPPMWAMEFSETLGYIVGLWVLLAVVFGARTLYEETGRLGLGIFTVSFVSGVLLLVVPVLGLGGYWLGVILAVASAENACYTFR